MDDKTMLELVARAEWLEKFSDYVAPAKSPRKYVKEPCQWCGWSAHMSIHTNPQLIGMGGPYHNYVAAEIGKAMGVGE